MRGYDKKRYRQPNPLVLQMGRVLENLVDSNVNDSEVLRLVPRPDFFLNYVFLVLRYREDQLKPEQERDEGLEEEISKCERWGSELGFPTGRLIAAARAVAQRTPTQKEIAEWKEKVLQAKRRLGERKE